MYYICYNIDTKAALNGSLGCEKEMSIKQNALQIRKSSQTTQMMIVLHYSPFDLPVIKWLNVSVISF